MRMATPNPSLQPTVIGMALGLRSVIVYPAPRGPRAMRLNSNVRPRDRSRNCQFGISGSDSTETDTNPLHHPDLPVNFIESRSSSAKSACPGASEEESPLRWPA